MNGLFLPSLKQFLTHHLIICQEKVSLREGEGGGGSFIQYILPLGGRQKGKCLDSWSIQMSQGRILFLVN